jgi:hypothetical protein
MPSADSLDRALLEEPEELHLQGEAQLSDFVQKERSLVRLFQLAHALGVSAGERSALMTEELRLEQCLGDRATVDGHERALLAKAAPVNGPRDELLARPTLALDQHRRVRLGHALDKREDFAHGLRATQDLFEAGSLLLLLEPAFALFFQPLVIRAAKQHHLEGVHVDRLRQIVEGAEPDGAERILPVRVSREDDDLGAGGDMGQLLEEFEPFLGRVRTRRQPEIEQDDLGPRDLDGRERVGPVLAE